MGMVGKEGKTDGVLGEEVTSGKKSLNKRTGTGSSTRVERLNLSRSRDNLLLKGGKADDMGRGRLVDLVQEGMDILFCFFREIILEVISQEGGDRGVEGLRREEVLNCQNKN